MPGKMIRKLRMKLCVFLKLSSIKEHRQDLTAALKAHWQVYCLLQHLLTTLVRYE